LADVILYLSGEEFEKTGVFNYLSRNDIAELTGMSKENAIRLLTEFKNDGLIKVDGKDIIINNIELLQKLSSIG
jgi:CRP/FNR family transcriptional regulator